MPITKTERQRTWSKFHRTSVCMPSLVKAVVSEFNDAPYNGAVVRFWKQDQEFLYDEYHQDFYNTDINGKIVALREIPGRIVTHEAGDGVNDMLLERATLEAQEAELLGSSNVPYYPEDFYTYDVSTLNEPVFEVFFRNAAYVNAVDQGVSVDLIKANMSARYAANIYGSIRQTPTEGSVLEAQSDPGVYRESIALVAPMKKFRRSRIVFSTLGYTVIVRSLSLEYTYMRRRTSS